MLSEFRTTRVLSAHLDQRTGHDARARGIIYMIYAIFIWNCTRRAIISHPDPSNPNTHELRVLLIVFDGTCVTRLNQ